MRDSNYYIQKVKRKYNATDEQIQLFAQNSPQWNLLPFFVRCIEMYGEEEAVKKISAKAYKPQSFESFTVDRGMNIYDFIKNHQNDVVVFGYGGIDATSLCGYYCFGLVYKMNLKIIHGTPEGTSNHCILCGILEALKLINRSCNIYVLTSTVLGFKKALKGSGPNRDLCLQVIKTAEEKDCSLKVIVSSGTANKTKKILNNSNKYFYVR